MLLIMSGSMQAMAEEMGRLSEASSLSPDTVTAIYPAYDSALARAQRPELTDLSACLPRLNQHQGPQRIGGRFGLRAVARLSGVTLSNRRWCPCAQVVLGSPVLIVGLPGEASHDHHDNISRYSYAWFGVSGRNGWR